MGKSSIGWLKHKQGVEDGDGEEGVTWGVVRGCSRISPGCGGGAPGREEGKHGGCYAERHGGRFCGVASEKGKRPGEPLPFHGFVHLTVHGPRWTGKVALLADKLDEPLGWKTPTVCFTSMFDMFHEELPNDEIAAIFAVAACAPHVVFKFLTKRSARMRAWFGWIAEQAAALDDDSPADHPRRALAILTRCLRAVVVRYGLKSRSIEKSLHPAGRLGAGGAWPLPNVHLGVSVELAEYLSRIDDLRAVPAVAKIVSFEPLLGPIPADKVSLKGIDQAIVGAESGSGARTMEVAWAEQLLDAATRDGCPFFLKQFASAGGRKILEPPLRGRSWTEATRIHPERAREALS